MSGPVSPEERKRLRGWCYSEAGRCRSRASQDSTTGKAAWRERADNFETIAALLREPAPLVSEPENPHALEFGEGAKSRD